MHTDTGPTPVTRRWVLALAAVASFMVALDTLVVSTALTTIRQDLGASVAQLEWTVNGYNLSFAVLLLPAAALGDRHGRRRLFAGGVGLFSVGSAACALAPSVGWLVAARVGQGAGAALVMPLGLALVGAAFPPERRGAAMGILQGITGLAVAGGPLVGGAVAGGIDWPWIFWVNVPIGVLTIPLILRRVPESRADALPLDLRGLALVTGASVAVVWGLVRSGDAGWGSAEVLAVFAAGAVLLTAFVAWQRRAAAPMLPPALFAARGFSAGNTAMFCTFASLFAAVFFVAQFLQTGLGESPLGAGLRLLPWTGTLFVVAPVAGALVDRHGERPFLVAGLALQGAGLAWLAHVAEPGMAYGPLVAPLMVAGLGVSMAIPSAQSAAVGAVDLSSMGKAAGVNSMLRELGGVFGIAVAAAAFAGFGGYASAADFTDGFVPALTAASALSLAGAGVSVLVPAARRRPPVAAGVALAGAAEARS